ncbi:MAG TPA: M14 family zinc carboxypeptidase [Candidatus Krumholzibacteria bacterium]|nr:M14 family zinc carboxypeptidase [Candidatus Krumholzibacteria bacterium]
MLLHLSGTTLRRGIAALVAGIALLAAAAGLAAENAIPVDHNGLPMWVVAEPTDFPVRIELSGRDALDRLLATVMPADFSRDQIRPDAATGRIVFSPRLTGAEAAAIEAAGFTVVRTRDTDLENRRAAEAFWAEQAVQGFAAKDASKALYYPTHAQIGSDFATLAATYPTLARTFNLGNSVQGRERWGIVISDDVNNTEAEPEVRLSASIHGDEPVDMVMLWNFAHYLLQNYGQAGFEDVTNLVDNYEIHIVPLYNPDGYVANSRYNANGVDLNRNFGPPAGTDPVQETENISFMAYSQAHHFVVSQNGHGGALVANYPWDYTYTRAPDDAALIRLALEYSTYNLPMYNSPSFPQGITEGADWYIVTGGLQDWTYDQTGCIDITMEISNTKWPAASTLDTFWSENVQSLMHYVKAARYGVHGVVTGSDSGLPLDATVTVVGNTKTVSTDPAHGDYYKLLPTGTFTLTFSAPGYLDKSFTGVATTWGTETVLDVAMDPIAHGDVAGTVTGPGAVGLDASVKFYSLPLDQLYASTTSSAGAGGAYAASLPYGDYRVEASAAGYGTLSQTVTVGASPATADFVLGAIENVTLFACDFEAGLDGWTGPWGQATSGYNSTASLTDSPVGNYTSSLTSIEAMAAGVDLTGLLTAEVSFWAHWDIENSWDGCFFEVSTNGGSSWTALAMTHTNAASGQGGQTPAGTPLYDNLQSTWVHETLSLASYIGQTDVRFRFRLVTDSSINKDGMYVDDFVIAGTRLQDVLSGVPGAGVTALALKAWPNPFNPTTKVAFTVPAAGPVELNVYDVRGRLVRRLASGAFEAGGHERTWDGRDDAGQAVGSGVYFAQVRSAGQRAVTKLMLVK